MSEFWGRYRMNAWTSADAQRIDKIIWPYATGAFLSLICVDSEVEGPASEALWTMGIILGALSGAAAWWVFSHILPEVPFGGGKIRRGLSCLGIGALYGLLGSGYVTVFNVVTGSSDPVVIEGPVVRLKTNSGGYSGPGRFVTFSAEGRTITFAESAERFYALKVGDVYRTEARLGGFGYYWRPGRGYWK